MGEVYWMEERRDDTWINLKGQAEVSQVSRVQDIPERWEAAYTKMWDMNGSYCKPQVTLRGWNSGGLRSAGEKGAW